ncbi:hypothetical protein EZV62_011883 [Acer yangbiense]|uniref:Uncharacterized protein n=1 Tax=Acer yangbiense TaxID=1000413 RepID=A0A5C7I7Y9_9ROSI|nr:hypothetical protein EZV62_011883 [Acer yangbiense]
MGFKRRLSHVGWLEQRARFEINYLDFSSEANLIEVIVGNISRRLINLLPSVLEEQHVGIESRVREIYKLLELELDDRDKAGVMDILNSCNFQPDIGLKVLRERSLITIFGIILDSDSHREEITHLKLNGKSFLGMSNLRLLIINDVDVHLFEDLEYLSNELRLLEWHGYPLKSLPSSFHPQRLVQFSLCYSHIEYIWKDIKHSMEYLKIINLSFSHNLIKTPDFEMIPNLERLDLQCCTKLLEVHKSVGSLGKLIVLNLNECGNLVVFPSDVRGLKSLKILNLNGYSKLDTLPLNLEEVEPLEELDISGTAIEQIVISSIVQLKNLKTLLLRGCKVGPPKTWSCSLRSWLMLPTRKSGCMGLMLPPLAGLSSLKKLDVSDCNLLEIPSDFGSLFSLEELSLDENNFVSLPDSISQLSRLNLLSLVDCQRLQSLPKLPHHIQYVLADGCASLRTISSALELTSPISLQFLNCFQLVETQGRNNNLAIMFLKRVLQIIEINKLDIHFAIFDIFLPGSEIPELFSYWSEGCTITWLPPYCLANDELIGFSVCAVMSIPDHSYDAVIMCSLENLRGFGYHRTDCKGGDHLWLCYFSKDTLDRNKDGGYDCGKGVTARFKIHDYKNRKKEYSDKWVKRCGIRPVYKQDVENLNELSATTDGAITMLSTLQGSRFRKCTHCIRKEINVDYSEDSSAKEGDAGTAAGDIGNSIYIVDQSEIQKVDV